MLNVVELSLISCANKAEYLPVKPASYISVVIVKLFVPVVSVPSTTANHPIVLNGNKKSHAVIQRSADDWGHTLLPANRHEAELPNHS